VDQGALSGILDFLSSPPALMPPPVDIPPPPMPLFGLVLLVTTLPELVIRGPGKAELVVALGMSDPPPELCAKLAVNAAGAMTIDAVRKSVWNRMAYPFGCLHMGNWLFTEVQTTRALSSSWHKQRLRD
jgi:hypothetical protein